VEARPGGLAGYRPDPWQPPLMKVEHKIASAFVIAFAAICLVGGITYLDARALLERNAWVVHTYQVLQKIDHSFGSFLDMEVGTRGFLLTGDETYLVPFETGAASIHQDLNDLQDLTRDNPRQQRNVADFRALADSKIATMQQRIGERRTHGTIPSLIGVQDKASRGRVRALTAQMVDIENRLLKERTVASAQSARRTLVTFWLLLGVAVFILLCFYVLIRHDLSERRSIAAALQESDRRFRGVMESAPDAMLISNTEGIISLSNMQASRLFGYSPQELAGRPLSSLLTDRASVSTTDDVEGEGDAARLSRERALIDLRARSAQLDGVRRGGERFPVDFSQSPLDTGQEHLLITAVRDRTDQQRAEDALGKFSLDLARSNAELERFAYVASHDLQEPLRMVSSYTQLLSRRYKGKLDANADEFIGYAVDGANRMQKLISDLLTLSRVGTQAKPSEPVDTGAVLQRVLRDMQPTIEAAAAEIIFPDNMPTVHADGSQIGQLFQNIIGNGVKFRGDAPPRVEIVVTPEGEDYWRFAFKDNGIGIEPQYFERIFVIFQRLHGKERYAGTGIGLAISKKIVERHGGKLWVESQPGAGTTFLFTLPSAPLQI
jgi:PAS domain S-box-containing protein